MILTDELCDRLCAAATPFLRTERLPAESAWEAAPKSRTAPSRSTWCPCLKSCRTPAIFALRHRPFISARSSFESRSAPAFFC